jgi:signal transduction histidine kinase
MTFRSQNLGRDTSVHWVARDGTILWADPAEYEPLGYTAAEYVGHNIAEFQDDAARADLQRRLTAGERLHDYDAPLRGPEGSIRHVSITSAALEDALDELHREVAQRERCEQQLLRATQMNDEFMAAAAHELRTPLATLKLQTESVLAASDLGGDRLRYQISKIDRQADRLVHFVDVLLDATRLSTGELELERAEVDLHALMRRAIRQAADEGRAGVAVTLDAPGAVVGCWDGARLEQAFGHLIGNALKYGGGVPVEIVLSATPSAAQVTIRDRGIGIDAADHDRIFGRFVRIASTKNYGGLGLGLWIVRRIVEAHGGKVSVESSRGEGAMFIVTLPRD